MSESPVEEIRGEASPDLPPEEAAPDKPSTFVNKSKISYRAGPGRPRELTFEERVAAWDAYVLGTSLYELAQKYDTSLPIIIKNLDLVAAELGFPDTHLDPELERFKLAESSERMKSAVVKCLKDSNSVLKDVNEARKRVKGVKNLEELDDEGQKKYRWLMETRQSEIKIVTALLGEYRAINTCIADLAGVRKQRPKREIKRVNTAEQAIEKLTEAEIRRLANPEEAPAIDITPEP